MVTEKVQDSSCAYSKVQRRSLSLHIISRLDIVSTDMSSKSLTKVCIFLSDALLDWFAFFLLTRSFMVLSPSPIQLLVEYSTQ